MKYIEHEFVSVAKRENNPKRNYLVVNRLQGKHVPVAPEIVFEMFDALADRLQAACKKERLLLIGFAETATAIGARLAVRLGSYYMQTTREQIPNAEYLLFSESHSHATEQKLVKDDVEKILPKVDRVVFVEDEVTTGNTILNIINILEKEYPDKMRFTVASVLNGMDAEAKGRYRERQIGLFYLCETNHRQYAAIAEGYNGDGEYISMDTSCAVPSAVYRLHGYLNSRRCVLGEAYNKACEALWEQIKAAVPLDKKQSVLILGTEEFMYPALWIGACLEKCGHAVKCHATTRSPIAVSCESDYPLSVRYELASFYEDGRRTFIYDLKKYDSVWILTDAINPKENGVCSLIHALESCGNDDIRLFFWGDNCET